MLKRLKRLPRFLFLGGFLLLVASLGGCASHDASVGWLEQSAPPAGQYKILRPVEGTASTTNILGYSTKPPHDLYDRARRDLVEDLELGNGRSIAHRTMEVTTRGFPPKVDSNFLDPLLTLVRVYQDKTVHFSGDLVRITGPVEPSP